MVFYIWIIAIGETRVWRLGFYGPNLKCLSLGPASNATFVDAPTAQLKERLGVELQPEDGGSQSKKKCGTKSVESEASMIRWEMKGGWF